MHQWCFFELYILTICINNASMSETKRRMHQTCFRSESIIIRHQYVTAKYMQTTVDKRKNCTGNRFWTLVIVDSLQLYIYTWNCIAFFLVISNLPRIHRYRLGFTSLVSVKFYPVFCVLFRLPVWSKNRFVTSAILFLNIIRFYWCWL